MHSLLFVYQKIMVLLEIRIIILISIEESSKIFLNFLNKIKIGSLEAKLVQTSTSFFLLNFNNESQKF